MLGSYYDTSYSYGNWPLVPTVAVTCNFGGRWWEPVESDLKAQRRRFREYVALLAELRGERARPVVKVGKTAKRPKARWGARSREQRTRREG